MFQYTIKDGYDILRDYNVDRERGLSSEEAASRLEKFGPNEIAGREVNWRSILLRQFKSPFIYLLIFASILALALGEVIDGLLIFLFLAINASLGFYQEYRSEKTVELLKKYVVSYSKVLRGGEIISINSSELVPGDIVIVQTGDRISADIRFIEAANLTVDETILTGESISIHKTIDALKKEASDYYEAVNLGFAGTSVLNGEGRGIVIGTGANTAMGKIARLTGQARHISNFEKGISSFSKFILKLVGVTLLFVFAANVFIKGDKIDVAELVLFSIALAVSVIPEALPVVTTFSLSRGARRLAKQKVVVKRLSAVEDLGGIEVLCTDKTGTLTENSLAISSIYRKSHPDIMLYANLAASSAGKKRLEPFDIALWTKLGDGFKKKIENYSRVAEVPFNPETRRNTVVVLNNGRHELITRGAPEVIVDFCPELTHEDKKDINYWIKAEGINGHRVLAIAKKELKGKDIDIEKNDQEYTFAGLISFVDSIKSSAYGAIEQAEALGVKIKILTGDSKEVAGAVAHQIGLVKSLGEVITATELERMPNLKREKALLKYAVFARVSPEQKYRIIKSLQEKYEVGFLGEGINDAPALKIAGVSLVVDKAADIAREAADIVLLKKSLKVILDGIEEGRIVFANTSKYIIATLASNFGNFFAVAIASLMIDFLPMLPLQILLVNLLSDFPMIAISTDAVDKKELKSPQRYNVRDIVLLAIVLGIVSAVFDFIFFGLFFRVSPGVLQTNWFIGSILTELVFLFSIRGKGFFLKAKPPSAVLSGLTILAFLATVILPYSSIGQTVFSFLRPSVYHITLILSIVAVYFICTEIVKLLYYRSLNNLRVKA